MTDNKDNATLSKEFLEEALNSPDISNVIKELGTEGLPAFTDAMEGMVNNEGTYGFFCKHCNTSASFNSKQEKRFYEIFHSVFGCPIEFNRDEDGQLLVTQGRKPEGLSNKFYAFADFIIEMENQEKKIEEDIKRATDKIEEPLQPVDETE